MEKSLKGIILAGGTGSRLHPTTLAINKHLLNVYDKPMIYYPLSILMLAGIKQIMLIVNEEDQFLFQKLLGNGSNYGIEIIYQIQSKPEGLPQAFVLAEKFIGSSNVMLVLGDNVIYGQGLSSILEHSLNNLTGAVFFTKTVRDPERFGIIEIDQNNVPIGFEEKPKIPKSNLASVGLYLFNKSVCEVAKRLKKSARGEFEMKDLFNHYLNKEEISIQNFGRGFMWLDTGTNESLHEASEGIKVIQDNQFMVGCLEEIALQKGWITKNHISNIINSMGKSSYRSYLETI